MPLGSVLAMTTTALPTLTARTAEDVLAAVPLVLGFVPEESVVMLTSGATHPFHARLDLPRTGKDRRAAAESLVGPTVRHRVGRVVFVLYAADAALARSCAKVLVRTFLRRGVDVADVLRSDGSRWFLVSLDGKRSRAARHALRPHRAPLHRPGRGRGTGDPVVAPRARRDGGGRPARGGRRERGAERGRLARGGRRRVAARPRLLAGRERRGAGRTDDRAAPDGAGETSRPGRRDGRA